MLRELPTIPEPAGPAPWRYGPERAGEPAGRYCHALICPVPPGVDAGRLRANLALAAGHAVLGRAVFAVEPVPGPAAGARARERRGREARRPIAADAAHALRLVLLSYADGSSELVAVAHRARLDHATLEAAVRMVLTGAPPSATATGVAVPPLGAAQHGADAARPARPPVDAEARDALRAHDVQLPGVERTERRWADLLAGLSLALARGTGDPNVVLGAVAPPEDRDASDVGASERMALAALDVDEERTVAGHRDAAEDVWREAARQGPTVPAGRDARAGLVVAEHPGPGEYLPSQELLFPVTVQVEPDGSGGVRARLWHGPDVACWWVAQLARHFAAACQALVAGPQDRLLRDVELLDAAEREHILDLGRTPGPSGFSPGVIHRAVEAQAHRRPDAVAIIDDAGRLTYRELDERANRLAQALRGLGVETGDRVGVCLGRSAELIAVLLAVFKAGAAYVPLDPEYPAARLTFVAEDAGLTIVVAGDDTAERFPGQKVVRAAELSTVAAECAATPPAADVGAQDAAYVIYTSGSTGRPKGVEVPHRNVLALLAGTTPDFRLGPDDTWTWFHSVAFDFSVWEIWGCLLTGGRLVVVPHWTCRSPGDFRELLLEHGVTVLNQTPSAFAQLLDLERREPTGLALRLVVFGGEPLDARMLLPWFDVHPESACRLVNMFGITETTVHVTAQTLSRAEALASSRSVGRPIPAWRVRILDEAHRILPLGAAGEIAVGGDGLALRYLNRPDLTEQRFITDADTGERLYLSGDRGRLLPDGTLEHLGRLDNQVKVRGYRIELDEIRAVLLEDPAVVAAAVVLHRGERADAATARLDAYVVLSAPGDASGVAQVRARAVKLLPHYMVPSTVTAVPALPLTANGKLDVAHLPAPLVRADAGRAAAGGQEAAILAVWRSVLGHDVGPLDDFFDLGGNSLLAVRLIAALRDRGLPTLPIQELYSHPTPRALAIRLEAGNARGAEPPARAAAS